MTVAAVFGGIGRAGVRFRWPVVLLWIAAAVSAATQLPALASVTQSDNTKFLPDSAPTQRATALAAPFGTADLFPLPVIVARDGAKLTDGDLAAVASLQAGLRSVAHVAKVQDAGRSGDGQAEQVIVFVRRAGGDSATVIALVDGVRAKLSASALPSGLSAHLTGAFAIQVDQQKASGTQGNQVQAFSSLFIVVLLVLIFRSLSLSLTTLAPAFVSVAISGPLVAEAAQHGLQVSPLAQFLLIVLVLGAGTDYGLFLVFRVREELRRRDHDEAGTLFPGTIGVGRSVLRDLTSAREPARDAVVQAVTKVGESVAASAGTVVLAMLTLLLASFPFYRDLGLPFAIAIVVTVLAALTLLPALLSIRLSLLAVKRSLFKAWFRRPKLVPWSIQGAGGDGIWGRVAGRIVRHPWPTLIAGVALFGGLSFAVLGYASGGFEGNTSPPAGSDSAAGQALQDKHFPRTSANPTALLLVFAAPIWGDPAPVATAGTQLSASPAFTNLTGPFNPGGSRLAVADYTRLHAALGPANALPPQPPATSPVPPEQYLRYRATANYVSPDGRTVQFATGLTAGDPASTAALDATPAIRDAVAAVARSVHATDNGVLGQASALYDISKISTDDLTTIVPIAILAIGLLLALVLRSLVAPLYLIASVGISYLAALGLAVLAFIKLAGDGGLVFFMPFLMFIFLLALGEDYNILIMSRIREEAHDLPLREAVVKALSSTGTTITSAGLVLAGSFIVLTVVAGGGSGSSQIRDIGLGLAFGILMDTFLVRTLLVPSTVVLLGRWNWWPSRLSRIPQPATETGHRLGPRLRPGGR
jgi:putative drug exporter of the RND superfamily